MSPYEYELDKKSGVVAQLVLFRNVQNMKDLKNMVISMQMQCCMINPALILDPFQVIIAANKAVLCDLQKKLSTKNVYVEILYNLFPSRNISQSLKTFGSKEEDSNVLIVAFRRNEFSPIDSVIPLVSGDQCPIDEINSLSDIELIKRTYGVLDIELKDSELLDCIVSRISTKDFFQFKALS